MKVSLRHTIDKLATIENEIHDANIHTVMINRSHVLALRDIVELLVEALDRDETKASTVIITII